MKVSKYNIYVEKEDRKFVYNQLRSSLLEIDEELFRRLSVPDSEVDTLDDEILEELHANGVVCDTNLNEENIILANCKIRRFSNDMARVTILPTLDCNFHCWYCYENHHDGFMTSEDVAKVLEFCRKTIIDGKIKHFQLDWFGGEPLMYFQEVVYPISKKVQEICANNNVAFRNTITTNGYLVNSSMIEKLKEIQLTSFQITLDGGKRFHNKTRFSKDVHNSYEVITSNIIALCRAIPNIDMTVRINYTPKNMESIDEIVNVFPLDIRNKITVMPQLVWQFKDDRNMQGDDITRKMEQFVSHGYKKNLTDLSCYQCYTENMKQFVVNYDLSVFKCTARDFSEKYSIGKIDNDGEFVPNNHFYDYFVRSSFENESCFDYDNRIAESLVEVMKVLDISSVLVVGDNLIYLDALLGMEILANGICDNDQAFHLAQKMNIAEYCQVVDWTQPIYVEDDDKYDSLLFLNQLGGNNDILSYLGNLSELTSHYMFFIEENMQESLKDTLEKSIASFHLKSNSELSKMLLAEFDMIENLQVCVLIKY